MFIEKDASLSVRIDECDGEPFAASIVIRHQQLHVRRPTGVHGTTVLQRLCGEV
jgi:hypothetical protein